jgi:putative acetyltransferase
LRANGNALISLVAEVDGSVAGHIMFSPLYVDSPQGTVTSIGLGPVAVLPDLQGRGIGSALIEAGLGACRALGYDCVFVLGHRSYYPRFGFRPARQHGVIYEDGRDSFMVVELIPGALDGLSGIARYGSEFDFEG